MYFCIWPPPPIFLYHILHVSQNQSLDFGDDFRPRHFICPQQRQESHPIEVSVVKSVAHTLQYHGSLALSWRMCRNIRQPAGSKKSFMIVMGAISSSTQLGISSISTWISEDLNFVPLFKFSCPCSFKYQLSIISCFVFKSFLAKGKTFMLALNLGSPMAVVTAPLGRPRYLRLQGNLSPCNDDDAAWVSLSLGLGSVRRESVIWSPSSLRSGHWGKCVIW